MEADVLQVIDESIQYECISERESSQPASPLSCCNRLEKDREREKRGALDETRQDILRIISPRLDHDPLSAGIAQPEIMHQRALPHLHPVPAPELLLADQGVEAAVPVVVDVAAGGEVAAQAVLFHPVELEVAERFAVPAADGGEAVFALEGVLEEGFLVVDGAGFVPGFGHARLVHPVVEEVGVAGVEVDVA